MRIWINGAGRLRAKLQAAASAGPMAIQAKFVQIAEQILTDSKQNYVPVDTGALRASGFTEGPEVTGPFIAMTLGFGGPSASYAVIVHEDLTKRHPVGQAKYLEIPLRKAIAGMANTIAQFTRNNIQRAMQRLGNVETNVREGREPLFGMPMFR